MSLVALALAAAQCSKHSGGGTAGGGGNGGGTAGGSSGGGGTAGGDGGGTAGGGGGATGGSESVLQRGKDLYRSSNFIESGLTQAAAKTMALDATFTKNATFPANGAMYGTASVLYLQEGPTAAGCPTAATGCTATARAAGDGIFFAFAALGANPNIYAFDETTGLLVWTAYVPGGKDGIRGTPVIDPTSRRLFVVTGPSTAAPIQHQVHALNVDDGTEVTTGGWPLALSKTTLTSGTASFNSTDQNMHGGMLLMNNILYVSFGGHFGDGGTYLGWVVAVDITDSTKLAGWATQSTQSGIWGAGGLIGDGTNVYAVTGNTGSGTDRSMSDSEEVVRLSGMAQLTRGGSSIYVPTAYDTWDGADLDFGSSTPAYVPVSGGTPLLIAPAKPGMLYLLDAANLSGSVNYPTVQGGELAKLQVASTTAESVYTAPSVYTSASGLHTAINVGVSPFGCTNNPGAAAVMSFTVTTGAAPAIKLAWCAADAGGGKMNYPPIATASDANGTDSMVWFMGASNGTQLVAVDGDTGANVFTTTGTACDDVPNLSWPIAVKNRIVVAALGHLCSWSPGGK